MLAMQIHEGWIPPTAGTFPTGSRSYRNHNPGNLRSSPFEAGQLDGFAYFKSDEIGRLAFRYDLIQKAKGNSSSGLTGTSTVRDLIFTWAPPTDSNDSEAYLQSIVTLSGLPETMQLSELLK